jgi:hypothetical protein
MNHYLSNGECIDDGRIPRSMQQHEGWYRGDTIHDKDPQKHPTWRVIAAVAVLCLAVVWVCGVGR